MLIAGRKDGQNPLLGVGKNERKINETRLIRESFFLPVSALPRFVSGEIIIGLFFVPSPFRTFAMFCWVSLCCAEAGSKSGIKVIDLVVI